MDPLLASSMPSSVPLGPIIIPRDTSRVVMYTGMALYGAAIVVGLVDVIWNIVTNRSATHTTHKESRQKIEGRALAVEKLFKILLFICLIFRVVWLAMRTFWSSDSSHLPVLIAFVISRVAFGFFFSCFTLESVHSSTYASEEFLPKLGAAFLITNAIMWTFLIVVVSLFVSGAPLKEGNPVYEANILTELGLTFILSLGFAFYGTSLLLMRCRSEYDDPSRFRYTVTSSIVTVLFVLCFALRVVAFGYRYVFRSYMDPNIFMDLTLTLCHFRGPFSFAFVFRIIAYYIPELVPALLQIYLVESSKARVNTADKYIADLYAGEAEKSLEEALRTGSTPSLRFGLGARRSYEKTRYHYRNKTESSVSPSYSLRAPERNTWTPGLPELSQGPTHQRPSDLQSPSEKEPLLPKTNIYNYYDGEPTTTEVLASKVIW